LPGGALAEWLSLVVLILETGQVAERLRVRDRCKKRA
jgi:hypothetical protein